MFDFPKYSQLDKDEQDPVVNHPLDECMLVYGPPGSGKTVLALYRTSNLYKKYRTQASNFGYIVYNNTLKDYIANVIKSNPDKDLISDNYTFHSWFYKYYNKIFGSYPPSIAPYVFDWPEILKNFENYMLQNRNQKSDFTQLIVDEGQDLPKEFYKIIMLVSNAYSVFMDENQRITETQTTQTELINILPGIFEEKSNIYRLKKNYRNTLEIAMLSREFYTGHGGMPDLPKRKGSRPICWTLPDNIQTERIEKYCLENTQSIGIFLPEAEQIKKLFLKLRSNEKLSPRLEYYYEKKKYDCPKCVSGQILIKDGRFGEYITCDNFKCDYSKQSVCPSCRKGFMKKRTYRATNYWICGSCKNTFNKKSGFKYYSHLKFSTKSILLLHYQSSKGLEFHHVLIPFLSSNNKSSKLNDENKMKFYVLTSRAREKLNFYKYPDQVIEILDFLTNKDVLDYK